MRTEKRPLRRALATALAAACLVFSPLFADLSAAQEELGAEGRPAKFLGNVWSTSQRTNWLDHWNQVTPENEGKWGSVQPNNPNVVNTWNWAPLDAIYSFAKANDLPIRFHVLVWGNQQPRWMSTLPPEEQLEHIERWFAAVAERYPDLDYIEVVNEPLHDPPSCAHSGNQGRNCADSGNYLEALGGYNGTDGTGWDWVLNAFRLARKHFGPDAKLMINDYSITNSVGATMTYLQIIEILQRENLIDGIGVQGHAFSTGGSMATHKANLDRLASTGLPIQVTEMDVDGPNERVQLADYQRIFPTFWEHPAVEGITLWGWRHGMWRTANGATLVRPDGTPKPALEWLMAYVAGEVDAQGNPR